MPGIEEEEGCRPAFDSEPTWKKNQPWFQGSVFASHRVRAHVGFDDITAPGFSFSSFGSFRGTALYICTSASLQTFPRVYFQSPFAAIQEWRRGQWRARHRVVRVPEAVKAGAPRSASQSEVSLAGSRSWLSSSSRTWPWLGHDGSGDKDLWSGCLPKAQLGEQRFLLLPLVSAGDPHGQFFPFVLVTAQPWYFSLRVPEGGPGPLSSALGGLHPRGDTGKLKSTGWRSPDSISCVAPRRSPSFCLFLLHGHSRELAGFCSQLQGPKECACSCFCHTCLCNL